MRSSLHRLPVLWRVFLVDALILVVGALVLALGPVTISYPVRAGELAVIVVGLVLMLAVSLLLLSRTLRPLRALTHAMREVDLLSPGRRVEIPGAGPDVAAVATSFNEMLDRLEAERRESGRMALFIQEEERRRVARELHDEVGQTLTAMLLQIEGVAGDLPEDIRGELDELRETARTGAEDVRRIAQRLRPEALEELGLQAALLALADGVARQTGLSIERRIERQLPLTTDDELVIYRVAQEALTNVVRHAAARTVALALERRGDAVVLRVTDDGRGIEPADLDSSFGIRGMRERALLVGARLTIDTAPGRGTSVELDVPAEPEEGP
jgi:two-component system sensor histidine kinase UhpB